MPDWAATLDAVSVRRGRRRVLAGVSLRVPAATVTLVQGANGAGKTTLLQVLADVAPASGRVRRAPGGCAFVPERLALAPALPVGEC